MGRAWYSEANAGLYLTIILRPTRTVPWLTLAVGLALHQVVSGIVADVSRVDIRWPNDVLLDGRKCAGILVTADGEAVLIGIGVNVNQSEFPDDLAGLATSILLATGTKGSREELLIALLRAIDDYLMLPAEEIRRQFQAVSSFAQGLKVEIEDTALQGVTCGLDAEGFLLVRTAVGDIERIVAGGVRPVGPLASATIPIPGIED
jgi:BirA family transcriptional regulator, biotin operon repressor / biotin---[acetyl-CoA-carboxylase] ligase